MNAKCEPKVVIAKNYEALCHEATKKILAISNQTIAMDGTFRMALAGGSTLRALYTCMASREYAGEFDWQNIHLFWGDERWVAPEDIRSKYRLAAESLLTRVDLPPENIHPIKTRVDLPETAAKNYESDLKELFSLEDGVLPKFDLMIMGIGRDGHTGSLFAGSKALSATNRLACPVYYDEMEEMRVTLTLPVINNAHHVLFFVVGREKAEVLSRIIEGEEAGDSLPAKLVQPEEGNLTWFVDQSAAAHLKSSVAY